MLTRLAFLCLLAATLRLQAVTPLPAGPLLQHQANHFDLQHKRLRFTPRGPAEYNVRLDPFPGVIDRGAPLDKPSNPRSYSWHARLPFPFAFAGKKWKEVTINLNGSLTFGGPETTGYPERDTWPDGTMRSLASAFDVRANTGERPMIVPLWGLNSAGSTQIFTRSARGAFAVTWHAVRYQSASEGYAPLGENTFQVRLERDGSIEFRYGDVAEKDGIVGVFCGPAVAGKLLDKLELPPTPGLPPHVDLRRAEVEDRGAGLRFLLTLAAVVPSRTGNAPLRFGVVAVSQGEVHVIRLTVDPAGARSEP